MLSDVSRGASIPSMEELIRQIRVASAAGLHYLALYGVLALPDICGALSSDNGVATPSKYKDWIRANVPEQASEADSLYGLRCSLLHQGRALPHGSTLPIAFSFGQAQLHNLSTEADGVTIGWISVPMLTVEITTGAERWFATYGTTNTVLNNMEKFARYRPEGLLPILDGYPVIA